MQVVLTRFARGLRFKSRSGLILPPSPVAFGGSVWVRARTASSRGTVSSRWYLHGSEQIRGRIYLSRGICHGSIVWLECSHGMGELLGSSPGRAICFFLLCAIYSMNSFDVEVIEINTIIQDSVPACKKNHTGVGAKITQESFHVLSHLSHFFFFFFFFFLLLFKILGFVLKF